MSDVHFGVCAAAGALQMEVIAKPHTSKHELALNEETTEGEILQWQISRDTFGL